LTQARRAGLFDRAAGVVFGSFVGCDAPPNTEATDAAFVLRSFADSIGIPVAAGFPFGHRPCGWSLPFGARARLDARGGIGAPTLTLLQSAVGPREIPGAPPVDP
jgi:muramoyltetrapeptide carboxypeptidase